MNIIPKSYKIVLLLLFCFLQAIAYPQVITVTGTVSSSGGEVLPGASVVVKGTTTGTTTDANGNYSLSVTDENAVLVFSFVG